MVTEGTRFRTAQGEVLTVEGGDAGTIRLSSGRLVVADPGRLDTDAVPLAETFPAGGYPVDVFRVSATTIACRMALSGAPCSARRPAPTW